MNIWAWIAVGYIAFNALVLIGNVGKPRKTLEPSTAVVGVVFLSLLAACVVLAAIS